MRARVARSGHGAANSPLAGARIKSLAGRGTRHKWPLRSTQARLRSARYTVARCAHLLPAICRHMRASSAGCLHLLIDAFSISATTSNQYPDKKRMADVRLTRPEVFTLVNRYIGVNGGYLGDFSYRSHREFYLEFCDLDINPEEHSGTTRERFMAVLGSAEPATQARILRGVLKKYPVGSAAIRTLETHAEITAMIARLEGAAPVASPTPKLSSAVVARAISDAETLLKSSGATSGVDRMHTALHGYLRVICDDAGLVYGPDPSITDLYKLLRLNHPKLQQVGPHGAELDRILKSLASAIDSLNTLRNRASVAHPNPALLPADEALLCINTARTLMAYFDAKIG